MLSPNDIKLTWSNTVPGPAGYLLEFATSPQGEFTPLGFFSPNQRTFLHPNLMPETTWYYRVRPYYGLVSNPVEIALPDTLSDQEYASRYTQPEDYNWAPPRTLPGNNNASKFSIRAADSIAKAAPTDLKAKLVQSTVSGFLLTWTNHASDVDGYLIEMKLDRETDFTVRAVLDRNYNSFGYAFKPPERRATLRVRAFYYGQPSNLAQETSGPTPPKNATVRPEETIPASR